MGSVLLLLLLGVFLFWVLLIDTARLNVTQSEIMAFDIKGFILEEGQGGKKGRRTWRYTTLPFLYISGSLL